MNTDNQNDFIKTQKKEIINALQRNPQFENEMQLRLEIAKKIMSPYIEKYEKDWEEQERRKIESVSP